MSFCPEVIFAANKISSRNMHLHANNHKLSSIRTTKFDSDTHIDRITKQTTAKDQWLGIPFNGKNWKPEFNVSVKENFRIGSLFDGLATHLL